MKRKKIDITSRYMVLLVFVLFVVNTILGVMLTYQSASAMKSQINARMLDITNTAAAMLDGDVLRDVTPDDRGDTGYETVITTLREFRENIELEYIYCIRDNGNKQFSYGLDPILDNPADFGSPAVYTEALYTASKGVPAVDETSHIDKWGAVYSAYSPVFDSMGRVAGIVAVDFDKEWYDGKIFPMIWTTVISAGSSLLVAAVIAMILTSKNRSRMRVVNEQLNELANNFDALMKEVRNMSGVNVSEELYGHYGTEQYDDVDEVESMRMKILALQDELYEQIENVKQQAYIDGMTGVRNKASYLNTEKAINEKIKEGTAAFSVIVFDMNGLKSINDDLGHEYGDMAIIDATNVLAGVYDKGDIYRIGGDEFIVILNTVSEAEVQNGMSRLEYRIASENMNEKPYKRPLSMSMGCGIYRAGEDKEYREVFQRADKRMYVDKADYYAKNGDRRRRQ